MELAVNAGGGGPTTPDQGNIILKYYVLSIKAYVSLSLIHAHIYKLMTVMTSQGVTLLVTFDLESWNKEPETKSMTAGILM